MQPYRLAKLSLQPIVALWNSRDLISEPWVTHTEPYLLSLYYFACRRNYVDHVLVESYWHCWGRGVVFCRCVCRGILWSVWQHAIAAGYVLLKCFYFCVQGHAWRKVFNRKILKDIIFVDICEILKDMIFVDICENATVRLAHCCCCNVLFFFFFFANI